MTNKFIEKVNKAREDMLYDYKVSQVASLMDRIDTLETEHNEKILKIKEQIKDVQNMKYMPISEGGHNPYYV